MKKIFATLALTCLCSLAFADNVVPGVSATGVKTERHGNFLSVRMELELADVEVPSNRAVLVTPFLVNGDDRVVLPSVAVYGRRRYYYYHRKDAGTMLSGPDETTILAKEKPETLQYSEQIPYESWMNGAELYLYRRDYGCCQTELSGETALLATYKEVFFTPLFKYVTPVAEAEKVRQLSGRSYIDFPVDRTEIHPDYRRNPVELEVIRNTIDAVRTDSDAKIDTVWLKGFASPESPYTHNADLAKGRVASLKKYIEQMYHFENVVMLTDYEPEDWDGLRNYVAESDLAHKNEILDLIDSDLEPDPKEWKIKNTYPEEYRIMLQTWYPALRHTDYRISYTIRSFSNLDEIRDRMENAPQKLSLNEMFLLAQSLEPGSAEYDTVFDTAVRMYPEDKTANLNAANAAMGRRDFAGAERYLAKAGDSAEAVYARAVLAGLLGDYERAETLFGEAERAGADGASSMLEHLEEVKRYAPAAE